MRTAAGSFAFSTLFPDVMGLAKRGMVAVTLNQMGVLGAPHLQEKMKTSDRLVGLDALHPDSR